jgi:hypothetical protein
MVLENFAENAPLPVLRLRRRREHILQALYVVGVMTLLHVGLTFHF